MKAVGILVRPSEDTVLGDVWSHEPFLQGEISKHMNIADASGPDRYDALIEYYRNKSLNSKPNVEENEYTTPLENNRIAGEASSSVNYNLQRSVHINDKFIKSDQMPLNNLLDLAEYLGPDIFQLWKAALSRKRVMLITTPPMENACKYVYSISLLGQVTSQFQRQCTKNIKPIFAVGVNDIPCTPDSIYQMKSNLYDVGVSLPSDPVLPHLQSSRTEANVTGKFRFFSSATALEAHNSADVVRYRILWQLTCRQTRINWKKIIEKEPKDALSTVKAITTGFLYWLYENPRTNNNAIFAQPKLRWLELFAGTNHGRGNERNAGAAGETNLLLDVDDDEDATLIDNSNLLEVVTRTPQKYTTKRHNEQLIESFSLYYP
ncbi:hypothetical protein BDF20DRAFT_113747 [Mycotypha africana]|uniref:uncharacterized protein n=1 Tax=Mycotypha africana TaxID=64632 RepID=UPI002301B3BC|nr:uncharacterized protein BDF20DRAFT_113747 [Mycotypha africana]KAI8970241.1 hypothetical protein BDF20DRAFT_113747 [Mycotypha africana]